MTYNPNIPQALDDPSVSQGQFLNNFFLLNQYFDVNHVPFTAGGNNGLHDKVNFPVSVSDPNLTSPQSSVYPKTFIDPITLASSLELFFQNNDQFFNTAQLTNSAVCNLVITNITSATPCEVTTATNHGLSTGNQVKLSGINGTTTLNGTTKTITYTSSTKFTLNGTTAADVTSYSAPLGYQFNGYISSSSLTRFGFVSPWGFIFNFGTATNSGEVYFSIPYPVGFSFYFPFLTSKNNSSTNSPYVTVATDRKKLQYTSAGNVYYLTIGK